jgi:hypothetical protein
MEFSHDAKGRAFANKGLIKATEFGGILIFILLSSYFCCI